jgi:hypothetical protein
MKILNLVKHFILGVTNGKYVIVINNCKLRFLVYKETNIYQYKENTI